MTWVKVAPTPEGETVDLGGGDEACRSTRPPFAQEPQRGDRQGYKGRCQRAR